jgi:hypothetical protein
MTSLRLRERVSVRVRVSTCKLKLKGKGEVLSVKFKGKGMVCNGKGVRACDWEARSEAMMRGPFSTRSAVMMRSTGWEWGDLK